MPTDPSTIKNYNINAESYNEHVLDESESIFHSYYEKPSIRANLPKLKGLEVISIGCGSGVDAKWIADNGASRVVGIDISEGLLEIAQKNYPDIEFYLMNMESLDFKDECFDLAYSSLAIHYLDDWTDSLREVYRVLKRGGRYVFSCGHPIDSSLEYESDDNFKYALLGRKVKLKTKKRTIFGDYMIANGNGVKPIQGVVGGVDVVVYHRTFSNMADKILSSGFSIAKIVEPLPLEDMKSVDNAMFEQLSRIPAFMIWVLTKN